MGPPVGVPPLAALGPLPSFAVRAGRGCSRTGFAPDGLFPELPPETPGCERVEGALAPEGALAGEGALSEEGALSRVGSLAVLGLLAVEGSLWVEGALWPEGAEVVCATMSARPSHSEPKTKGSRIERRDRFMEEYRPHHAGRHGKRP